MSCIRSTLPVLRARTQCVSLGCTQKRCATVRHGRKAGRPGGKTSALSGEKLAVQDEYPITKILHDTLFQAPADVPKKRGRSNKTVQAYSSHLRTQIVSPELCDDILNYIGPSLEKQRGCDILDINPGACLWSQKLHEFLKPRSHILLEPNPEQFKHFIDPLLEAPGSKYTLVVKDITQVDSYRELVNEGHFPHQKQLDHTNDGATTTNDTLLVIGSLAWDPRLPGLAFDSMGKQLYYHFTAAAWYNDLFHAFGPVKTLLWMQHDDFIGNIAQRVSGMQKANAQLEMTHNVQMVVGAERKSRPAGRASPGREPQYELESFIRALQAGKASGVGMPPKHRQDYAYDFAKHFEKQSGGSGIIRAAQLHEYLHEQHMNGIVPLGLIPESFIASTELEKELMKTKPNFHRESFEIHGKRKGNVESWGADPEISQFGKLRSTVIHVIRNKVKVEVAADIGEELYLLECKALETTNEDEKKAILKKIDGMDEQLDKAVNNIGDNYKHGAASEVDDRIQLRHPPGPRVQWDKRPYEPLAMFEKEVWPKNRMALISTIPKPKPIDADSEWFEWLQDFIYGLYKEPAAPIATALDSMQHGLSDIIKDCPSLRDPKVGGRLLMKHLRVRMLTMEMLKELVAEYRDWPFKAPGSDHNKYFRHKVHSSSGW